MSDRWTFTAPSHVDRRLLVAGWLCMKYRLLAAENGTQVAATRLRKYGVPLEIALRVLGIRPTHNLPRM